MIYSGSTPKFLIRIKDSDGTVLDPDDSGVLQIRIIIFNSLTGETITKQYYKGALENYDKTRTKRKVDDDSVPYLLFSLSKQETENAKGNSNQIQVEIDVVDQDIPTTNTRTVVEQGKFCEIKQGKS